MFFKAYKQYIIGMLVLSYAPMHAFGARALAIDLVRYCKSVYNNPKEHKIVLASGGIGAALVGVLCIKFLEGKGNGAPKNSETPHNSGKTGDSSSSSSSSNFEGDGGDGLKHSSSSSSDVKSPHYRSGFDVLPYPDVFFSDSDDSESDSEGNGQQPAQGLKNNNQNITVGTPSQLAGFKLDQEKIKKIMDADCAMKPDRIGFDVEDKENRPGNSQKNAKKDKGKGKLQPYNNQIKNNGVRVSAVVPSGLGVANKSIENSMLLSRQDVKKLQHDWADIQGLFPDNLTRWKPWSDIQKILSSWDDHKIKSCWGVFLTEAGRILDDGRDAQGAPKKTKADQRWIDRKFENKQEKESLLGEFEDLYTYIYNTYCKQVGDEFSDSILRSFINMEGSIGGQDVGSFLSSSFVMVPNGAQDDVKLLVDELGKIPKCKDTRKITIKEGDAHQISCFMRRFVPSSVHGQRACGASSSSSSNSAEKHKQRMLVVCAHGTFSSAANFGAEVTSRETQALFQSMQEMADSKGLMVDLLVPEWSGAFKEQDRQDAARIIKNLILGWYDVAQADGISSIDLVAHSEANTIVKIIIESLNDLIQKGDADAKYKYKAIKKTIRWLSVCPTEGSNIVPVGIQARVSIWSPCDALAFVASLTRRTAYRKQEYWSGNAQNYWDDERNCYKTGTYQYRSLNDGIFVNMCLRHEGKYVNHVSAKLPTFMYYNQIFDIADGYKGCFELSVDVHKNASSKEIWCANRKNDSTQYKDSHNCGVCSGIEVLYATQQFRAQEQMFYSRYNCNIHEKPYSAWTFAFKYFGIGAKEFWENVRNG